MKVTEEFHSKVYTDRPEYADYPAREKFQAILGIIGTRLKEYPKAICSYSGGSDSDIMIDLLETARDLFQLPPIKYVFFNTGLEMAATKNHVKETMKKYGVEIEEVRPKKNIVLATREYGLPFMTKIFSKKLCEMERHNVPLSIKIEYDNADDKPAKLQELKKRYPNAKAVINFLCSCDNMGIPCKNQLYINSERYLYDFLCENPIPFKCSAKCCDYCKKQPAHGVQKGYEMIITGERKAEGGQRSATDLTCFTEQSNGQFRLRPLYYVSDSDKAWYKERYGIRYSDAYEVYGLTRTGCCGCSISSKAISDLEKIRPYEPNVVKAAWNIFGESYLFRQKYNEYKAAKKGKNKADENQLTLFEE